VMPHRRRRHLILLLSPKPPSTTYSASAAASTRLAKRRARTTSPSSPPAPSCRSSSPAPSGAARTAPASRCTRARPGRAPLGAPQARHVLHHPRRPPRRARRSGAGVQEGAGFPLKPAHLGLRGPRAVERCFPRVQQDADAGRRRRTGSRTRRLCALAASSPRPPSDGRLSSAFASVDTVSTCLSGMLCWGAGGGVQGVS
jgi:hypothetical protein